MAHKLWAEGHREWDVVRTVVKPSFVVICIAVGGRTCLVDKVDVLSLYHNPIATTFWADWRGRAAKVLTWLNVFWLSESIGRRIVPFFARGKAHGDTATFPNPQIANVIFSRRTCIQAHTAVGRDTRSTLKSSQLLSLWHIQLLNVKIMYIWKYVWELII